MILGHLAGSVGIEHVTLDLGLELTMPRSKVAHSTE